MRFSTVALCAVLVVATVAIASPQGFRALHDYSFDEFPDHIVFRTGAYRVPANLAKGWDHRQFAEESERLVKYHATKATAAEATSEFARVILKHALTRQYLVHIHPFDSTNAESDPSVVRDAIKSLTGQDPVYMPHNTFLVYANPEVADSISKLPRVRWIGQMPAEHKYTSDVHINPDTRPTPPPIGDSIASADGVAVMSNPAPKTQFSTLGAEEPLVECSRKDTNRIVPGWRRLRVKFVPGAFEHSKEAGVMMTKFISEWHTADSKTSATITLMACHTCEEVALLLVKESLVRQAVEAISALEFVEAVENLSLRRVKNRDAQWIVQTGVTNSRTVWDKGLHGTGQIVGIGDTGLDYTHCSFRDTAVPFDSLVCATCTNANAFPCTMSTTNCLQPRTHRKLVGYWRFVDNLDYLGGHGTHVSGSVAGNASPNTADAVMIAHNGLADQAKIVFTDIGDSGGSLDLPPSLSRDYFQYPYSMGARIHTNSWGGAFANGYSTDSIQLDTYTNTYKDMLVLFAAGNDGDSGPSTIDPEGQAKNILTVGAGGVPSTHLAMDAQVKATTEWIDLRRVACTLAATTPYVGEYYTSTATVCANLQNHGATGATCASLQTDSCNLFNQHDYCCTIANAVSGTALAGAWKYVMRNNFQMTRSCCLRERQQLGMDGNADAAIDKVAYFSSRGPTSDGRIKPEVISPGYSIVSTFADNNATSNQCSSNNQTLDYGLLSMAGTSMATPVTAGSMALVRQYFAHGWYATGCVSAPPAGSNLTSISSALLRAMVINSGTKILGNYRDCAQGTTCPTRALTFPGTDVYIYGFGRTTLANVLRMPGDPYTLKFWDISTGAGTGSQRLATGQTQTFSIVVQSASRDLKVTLVWTDPPGTAAAAVKLVNDLDLTVTSPSGTVYLGNAYISLTNGARDSKNTVEQVIINSPALGTYTITVKGTNIPTGPQDFALVATSGGAPICSYGWVNGTWDTCGCEVSTQSRTVTCQSSAGAVVADSLCNGTKPTTTRSCIGSVCPAAQSAWIGTWDYSSSICDPAVCCCFTGPIEISSAPLATSSGAATVTGTATSGSFYSQSNLTWTSGLKGLCNGKSYLSFSFAAQGQGAVQNLTFRYNNPAGYSATYRARLDSTGMTLWPLTNTVPTVCGSTTAVNSGRSSTDDPSVAGSSGSSGPSLGMIIGIVIGVVAVAALVAAAVLYYRKKNAVPIALQNNTRTSYPGASRPAQSQPYPAPAPAPAANPYGAYPPQATYGAPPAYPGGYPAQPQYAPQPVYASQSGYPQYPSQPYQPYPSQPVYAPSAAAPPAYGGYTDEGLPESVAAPVVPPRQAPALPPRSPPPVPPRNSVEMNNLRS